MGTTVFPDAELKIYLTATPEIRAERRYKELQEKNPVAAATTSLEQVLDDIRHRDRHDMNREHAPLRQAEDAHLVDTSDLTIEQVVDSIKNIMEENKVGK